MSGFTENVSGHLLVLHSITLEHLSFKITNFQGKKKNQQTACVKPFEWWVLFTSNNAIISQWRTSTGNGMKSVWMFLTKEKEDKTFIAVAERSFSLQ